MSYEIEIEYYDQDGAIFYIGETPYEVELYIETRMIRPLWRCKVRGGKGSVSKSVT